MSIRMAARQAMKSSFQQHRVGAVIVKGGRILSTGFNSKQPSRLLGTWTRHAEASAVLKLLKQRRLGDLSGADIYVTRYTKGGAVGLARPCADCQRLLRSVGVRCIFYTTNNGDTVMEKV